MDNNDTTITILYFASLGEDLACTEEQLSLPTINMTIQELIILLSRRGEHWAKRLSNTTLHCAVNHAICDRKKTLKAGDEVAFFPPVTGG